MSEQKTRSHFRMVYDIVFRNDELRAMTEGRVRRVSPVLVKRLQQTIEKLRNDPTGAAHAHRLRHNYAGLWSAHVTEKVRLLYKLCADCLADPACRQQYPLPCCRGEEPPDRNRINLLLMDDYHRN